MVGCSRSYCIFPNALVMQFYDTQSVTNIDFTSKTNNSCYKSPITAWKIPFERYDSYLSPKKRNKLITPFFIYISMVFCCPSTLCCIPGQLHLLIIFYPLCRRRGRGWTKKSVARSQIPVLVSPPHLPGRRTQSKGREYSVQEALLSKKIYHPLPSSGETKVILPSSITMLK